MPTRKRILKEVGTILLGAVAVIVVYLLATHKEVLSVLLLFVGAWVIGFLIKTLVVELLRGNFNDY